MNDIQRKSFNEALACMSESFGAFRPEQIAEAFFIAGLEAVNMQPLTSEARIPVSERELIAAALNMVDVKGRHHSEIAMKRLFEAAKNYRATL